MESRGTLAKMPKLAMVLGIRPDVIRASLMIKELKSRLGDQFEFIWSGQHYSENMRDIFFQQLEVPRPDVILELEKESDSKMIGSLIGQLGGHFERSRPEAVVFLGDTNTVLGSLAAASLGIPIVHIEGCMRSYDWRMPEEKYRSTIDHLADVIYAYLPEYKEQGLLEGIRSESIVLTGNPIVDVLEHYFLSGKIRLGAGEKTQLLNQLGVAPNSFWVMTCHRRENVESRDSLAAIVNLAEKVHDTVVFASGYRTQRMIAEFGLELPKNVKMIDPIGYVELLELMSDAIGVLSDSGTVVEETAILGVPTIQMRSSTERPQVYDTGFCFKFDPRFAYTENELANLIRATREASIEAAHNLGDGRASETIVADLIARLENRSWPGHSFEGHERPLNRNYGAGLLNQGITFLNRGEK
jgi:UDP-N-acetylglucosamine 2-epimerase (non-hydrolysing)